MECYFQPAGFLHLKEILHKGLCLYTCPEEQCKLTRIMPQHTPRTTRRSSEQTRTVCTDGKQMVWRPILGILARVGQNSFRGGIVESLVSLTDVNFWRRKLIGSISRGPVFHAQCWLQGTAWRTSKMPKFFCWKGKQFMEEVEQLLRDGIGDSDPWKELCDLTPHTAARGRGSVVMSPCVTHG